MPIDELVKTYDDIILWDLKLNLGDNNLSNHFYLFEYNLERADEVYICNNALSLRVTMEVVVKI